MNITDLFKKLSYGGLSNLSLGVEGSGAIVVEKQPTVLMYVNEALTRLFTRFVLKEKAVLIEQVSHITNYHLLEKYSQSRAPQAGAPFPYILDLYGEPFIEDVIRISALYDGSGCGLPLNDEEQPHSAFTPQAGLLQIPNPVTGRLTSVAYQARHPELTMDNLEQEIEIPVVLEGALIAYTTHLLFSDMITPESSAKASMSLQRYEDICQEAIDRDIVNSSVSTTNTRFAKRGWV